MSAPNVYRPGGPTALVTARASFSFDRENARFRLESVHPGHTVDSVIESTGFEFERPLSVPVTPDPDPLMLELIDDVVSRQIAELYPKFAAALAGTAEPGRQSA